VKINLTLAQKGFLLVAIPLAFELICVGVLLAVWQESRNQTARAKHDRLIVAETNNIMRLTLNAAQTDLLNNAFPSPEQDNEQERSLAEISAQFHTLNQLVKDDPLQKSLVSRASQHLQRIDSYIRAFKFKKAEYESDPKIEHFLAFNKEVRQFGVELTKLLAAQELREKALNEEEASSQQKINALLLTLIVSSISLAVGLAIYFNMQAARRLKTVLASITNLSSGEGSGGSPLEGKDEFALLDQDIHKMATKLKEATSKERAVVENALDVIFSINTKGQFTAVNPAGARCWGRRIDQLLEMTISDLLETESRSEVINRLREAAIDQIPCQLEAKTIGADGSKIEQMWSVTWSKSEQTLFCVAHDITERKRVEQLKQEFVAMITHDLRTPLASIKLMLELLAGPDSTLSPQWRAQVKTAEESSARLISLINDLLDLEKMQAGKLVIEPDICVIDDLIDSSIAAVHGFAASRNITFSNQRANRMVLADERRLIQVIVNLLSNAIKFSPVGSAVNISTLAVGKLVELRISDKGRGIPADRLPYIFDRFEQVSAADGRDQRGTGLGLAICQEIIKAHDGQIGVESKEGEGSTFWLRLPSAE